MPRRRATSFSSSHRASSRRLMAASVLTDRRPFAKAGLAPVRGRGGVLLETFTKRCAGRGVPCDTTLATGIVANEICDQARVADLVVIGHRGVNEQFSTGLLGSTTESVARKSPKPVFVSPMRFKEIRRPLLAYDGSQRASAAMHAAAEVASALSLPLTVIHVAREEAAEGTRVLDEARRYLHSYGLALSCETILGHPTSASWTSSASA